MTTLVVGLGNPLRGDDGVGPLVVRAFARSLPPGADVEVDEVPEGGLRLMERLVGYEAAILVDAVRSGTHRVGSVLRLEVDDLPTCHAASSHDLSLTAALDLARSLGLAVPDRPPIVAVEVDEVMEFCAECTAEVRRAVPAAVAKVHDCWRRIRAQGPCGGKEDP
jgi:hydrogenase maturation protease